MLGYKSAIPSASGVSARLHSADPHLQRTKRSLVGVHATKVQFKGIRQGESRLLAAEPSSTPLLPSLAALFLSWSPERHGRPGRVKGCWGFALRVWRIYMGNCYIIKKYLYGLPKQLKSSQRTWRSHSLSPNADLSHVFMWLMRPHVAPSLSDHCSCLMHFPYLKYMFEFYEQFIYNLSCLWCYCLCVFCFFQKSSETVFVVSLPFCK